LIRRLFNESGGGAASVCGITLLLLAGCARSRVEFVEVHGKVTMNGKPLAGVIVTFYPETESKEALPFARGKTDAAGNYSLATLDGRQGAIAGKHRVVVNWPLQERGDNWDKAPAPQLKTPVIPLKYTTASDTPFILEVKGDGPQTIDLVLQP
jgi:hypothetical protein